MVPYRIGGPQSAVEPVTAPLSCDLDGHAKKVLSLTIVFSEKLRQ